MDTPSWNMQDATSEAFFVKEILQGAPDTCDIFTDYLRVLELSDGARGSEVFYLTALGEVQIEGTTHVAVSDSLGFIRHINLSDSTFRLFAVVSHATPLQSMGDVLREAVASFTTNPQNAQNSITNVNPNTTETERLQSLVFYLRSEQHCFVQCLAFHQEDCCAFFSLFGGRNLYHTGWVHEPDLNDYDMFVLGKASRTITSIRCSSNHVAVGDQGGSILVWSQRDKALLRPLEATLQVPSLHSDEVCALEFISKGIHLVSGSSDGVVNVTELTTGALLHTLMCEAGAIASLSSVGTVGAKKESCFATGNAHGALSFFSDTGSLVHLLPTMTGSLDDAVVSVHSVEDAGNTAVHDIYVVGSKRGVVTVFSKKSFLPLSAFSTGVPLQGALFAKVTQGEGIEAYRLACIGKTGAVWMWPAERFLGKSFPHKTPLAEEILREPAPSPREPFIPTPTASVPPQNIPQNPPQNLPPKVVPSPTEIHNEVIPSTSSSPTNVSRESSPISPQGVEIIEINEKQAVKKRDRKGRELIGLDLEVRDPKGMMALAGKSVGGSTSSWSKPSGERAARLSGEAERVAAERFEVDEYKAQHPAEYSRQQLLHPAEDVTTVAKGSRRYTTLPPLEDDTISTTERNGFTTTSTSKQLDPKWVASLSHKPPFALPAVIAECYLQPRSPGETYDCPAPSGGALNLSLPFPSANSTSLFFG